MIQPYYCKRFENWNLPDLMVEAAEWIGDNEINASDVVFGTFDDPGNEVCSTVWFVTVYYVED
jgi:hypothetical protein